MLRRYDTLEHAVALMTGGERKYRRLCNLEGLAARGFREALGRDGQIHLVHDGLGIRVSPSVLCDLHMLPALDDMIARR